MNFLQGTITEIVTEGNISLVKVSVGEKIFSSIVLDTPATDPYLQTGHSVKLLFKETEVIISRSIPLEISVQNKMECRLRQLTIGKILCQLTLGWQEDGTGKETEIHSIITRNACEQLHLQVNDKIIALIKTNEVSLAAYD